MNTGSREKDKRSERKVRIMKFCDCPIRTNKDGFQYVRDDVMVAKTEMSCLTCGAPSRYVEVISEGRFCSDECLDAFYKEWAQKFFSSNDDEEDEEEVIEMQCAVAYCDKNSEGFGKLPFVIDGFDTTSDCRAKRIELEAEGYQRVLCFEMQDNHPEEITWEYVFKNVIKTEEEYGLCKFCDCYLPKEEWPMQCWFRGMLHPYTCSDFEWKGKLVLSPEWFDPYKYV